MTIKEKLNHLSVEELCLIWAGSVYIKDKTTSWETKRFEALIIEEVEEAILNR